MSTSLIHHSNGHAYHHAEHHRQNGSTLAVVMRNHAGLKK
jgi:hypothetical protein